jgi:anti-anti-sigma factor
MNMAFTASTEVTANNVAKITVAGELDASVASIFKDEIEKLADQPIRRLALIMSDLSYIASAGLRVLIFAKQKMGSDVDIFVVGAQEQVVDTLEMTGFQYSVTLLDEYDESTIEAD